MRGAFLIILGIFSVISGFGQSSIKVKVEGLKKNKGELFIGLYNSDSTFKDTTLVFAKKILPVDTLTMQFSFDSIPDGEYAITLFHDVNSNGKLDKNILGAPKEPYGFSNNPRIVFKSPKFDKCQFSLVGETEVLIKLK